MGSTAPFKASAALFVVAVMSFTARAAFDDLLCEPSDTKPKLSWCRFNNPFILSDFLSRNSSDLTARGDASFDLSYRCDGDPSTPLNRSCKAISQIQTATYGTLHDPLNRLVIFTDVNGRMLFVNFNNNTMATSIDIAVQGVLYFDSIELLTPNPQNATDPKMDVALLVGNTSIVALASVDGLTGAVTLCMLFPNQTDILRYKLHLAAVEFFPHKKNASMTVNMGWVWERNETLRAILDGLPVQPWIKYLRSYALFVAPTPQAAVSSYIKECTPNTLPGDSELYLHFYFLNRTAQFRFISVEASNISFVVAFTEVSVHLVLLSFSGSNETNAKGNIFWAQELGLLGDWCTPTAVQNMSGQTNIQPRQPSTVFCVPDANAVITSVDVSTLDDFSDVGSFTRDLWLFIGLRNASHAWVHVMDFPELTFTAPQYLTPLNPLGLRPDFGQPTYPCDFDTEVWVWESSMCQPRFVLRTTFSSPDPVTGIQAVPIVPEPNTANASNINVTLPLALPLTIGSDGAVTVRLSSQEHVAIFVGRSNKIEVFSLHQVLGAATAAGGPVLSFQHLNTVSFMGPVENIHVSENAQHLFAAISRSEWELASQQRYVEVCGALEADPTNPFLLPFSPECAAYPPQQVNLNSFTQYASYCSALVLCPELNSVSAQLPGSGRYAERPAVEKPCPVGSFCTFGQKQACPPGFYCGESGMSRPTRCLDFSNYSSTCSQFGLSAPVACPDGSVCIVNHIPGLPAPPGQMVPAPPALRTSFLPCPHGWWCNLGVQQPYNGSLYTNSSFTCPANTFCLNSSVLEPTICECQDGEVGDGDGGNVTCDDRTLYCPAGTTNVSWCPAGSYCTQPNASVPCVPTQYCPPGTFAPQLCPAGSYCPTAAEKVLCPDGHYCQQGSVVPTVCNYLTVCPAGSQTQSRSFLAPVALIVIVIGVLLGFYAYTKYLARGESKRKNRQPMSPSARQFVLSGGNDYLDGECPGDAPKAGNIPISRFETPTIEFEEMGLTLRLGEHKGKTVLDKVSGTIPPGSFVAVMGPSGSGKSTFMHTLAGKAFYGQRSGRVLVNGSEVDLTAFAKVIGFVKQDDIMLRELTVGETLLFNARMRYDKQSVDKPAEIANAMLRVLDLGHVRDVNIGDEKKRGISGGQRKRVNIGMEMCALPCILFLDEPTSGLDSSSSMIVCGALRAMADAGVTVIAVIHQPRFEIFQMFHKVLLLAKGGKLVYYGAPGSALPYFEEHLGIPCPQHVNPPDFFMDTISGENEKGLTVDDMVAKWKEYEPRMRSAEEEAARTAARRPSGRLNGSNGACELAGADAEAEAARPLVAGAAAVEMGVPTRQTGRQLAAEASRRSMPGFFAQLRYFTGRSLVQLSRDLVWFFTDLVLVLVAGFFLGLVFSRSEYRPPLPGQIVNRSLDAFQGNAPPSLQEFFNRPIDDPIISEASLTCMAIGMTGVTAALRVFGNEQIVYWREASAGMSTTAYFVAKNLTHLLFIVLSPLLYLTPFLTFVSARAPLQEYYWVCVLLQFTTTGLGYLISVVAPSGLAQLAGVVVVLVFSMFGGSRPTLPEIDNMFVALHAMPYVSYIRWGQEALYLQEIRRWGMIEGVDINPSLELFGYHLEDFDTCVYCVVAFGLAFRALALAAMVGLNRDQKH